MINYAQFEPSHPDYIHLQIHPAPVRSAYNLVLEQCQGTVHTNTSMHQPNIQEINDRYSSIEHSANILDHIEHKQNNIFSGCQPVDHSSQQESGYIKKTKKEDRKLKNETKNIPKNFGKGIISFIQRNEKKFKVLLSQHKISFSDFMAQMRQQKRKINTISDLRRLWTDPLIGKCMRIISNLFFRRYAMHYIFNSRISNYSSHIKYRLSLWDALRNPEAFNHIKEF